MMVDEHGALGFEDAFARLEAILDELRHDGLPLERALVLYEQGRGLAEHCDRLLQQAELRITALEPTDQESAEVIARDTTRAAETEW